MSFKLQIFAVFSLSALIMTVHGGRTQPTAHSSLSLSPSLKNINPKLCPFQTPEEWQQFLERNSANRKWAETCEDSTCDSKYYSYVKENIDDLFRVCAEFIASHDQINRCTKNMRTFTPAWMQQHNDDSYGFTVTNHQYLFDQDAASKPSGMMKPPGAIVAALPDLAAVEAAARSNGWKYLTHDSALGGFRTFVVISDPQGRFDQWMLLNLKKGDSAVENNTPMSVITAQKKDASGKELPQVQIHFRDYSITRSEEGKYGLDLNENGNGKCYACHASGMRQLIARRTPILEAKPVKGEEGYSPLGLQPVPADFAYKRLMEFNKKIRSYGAPDWNGRIAPEDHGPTLGKAQGCMDCHDGKSRGVLTVSSSHAQIRQKIYHEMSMPPDTSLPRWIERKEMKNPAISPEDLKQLKKAYEVHEDLVQDFENSRFPILKKWFLETPCL